MVPSVKILALKMQFRIRKEVKMLPTFLRCFPNVETLHVLVRSHSPHVLVACTNFNLSLKTF
jgi:hypothetical protein